MPDEQQDPQRQTVWVCKVDDTHTIRLEDIPAKDLIDLEQKFGGGNWLRFVVTPLYEVGVALAMYERSCALAGVEPRDLTFKELVDRFELVSDDRPDSYSGGLPDPKVEDLTIAG